jgi:anaerobic ribonucleoside-triphosphate reductase activating protein
MLKYLGTNIVFKEIPGELTIAIELTNCPNKCKGCHSPWLQENIGSELSIEQLNDILTRNMGFTCICFMGGDNDHSALNELAKYIRNKRPMVRIAWYSGCTNFPKEIELENFDYIKLGSYDEKLGGLDSKTTNQHLFRIMDKGKIIDDITYLFWKEKA